MRLFGCVLSLMIALQFLCIWAIITYVSGIKEDTVTPLFLIVSGVASLAMAVIQYKTRRRPQSPRTSILSGAVLGGGAILAGFVAFYSAAYGLFVYSPPNYTMTFVSVVLGMVGYTALWWRASRAGTESLPNLFGWISLPLLFAGSFLPFVVSLIFLLVTSPGSVYWSVVNMIPLLLVPVTMLLVVREDRGGAVVVNSADES